MASGDWSQAFNRLIKEPKNFDMAKVQQLMTKVDELETQLAASRATAANLLSALVAELTGTPNNGKVSVPSASTTGRRGRPKQS
jgi:hypothetical protein